jgi:hypothetical protein
MPVQPGVGETLYRRILAMNTHRASSLPYFQLCMPLLYIHRARNQDIRNLRSSMCRRYSKCQFNLLTVRHYIAPYSLLIRTEHRVCRTLSYVCLCCTSIKQRIKTSGTFDRVPADAIADASSTCCRKDITLAINTHRASSLPYVQLCMPLLHIHQAKNQDIRDLRSSTCRCYSRCQFNLLPGRHYTAPYSL